MGFLSRLLKSKKTLLKENAKILSNKKNKAIIENKKLLNAKLEKHLLIKTKNKISSTLNQLKYERKNTNDQWISTYNNFSWWNKLKYPEKLNLTELDQAIYELEELHESFYKRYSTDIESINNHYHNSIKRSENRINTIHYNALEMIKKTKIIEINENDIFNKISGFLCLQFLYLLGMTFLILAMFMIH